MSKPTGKPVGNPPDPRYDLYAEWLGITHRHAQRIGVIECARLLTIDLESRSLVISRRENGNRSAVDKRRVRR